VERTRRALAIVLLALAAISLASAAAAQPPPAAVMVIRHAPHVELEPLGELALVPGEESSLELRLTNRGNATETLRLDVLQLAFGGGEARLAFRVSPGAVTLGPDESAHVTLHAFAFTGTPLGEVPFYLQAVLADGFAAGQWTLVARVQEAPVEADASLPAGAYGFAAVAVVTGSAWVAFRRLEWLRYLAFGLLPLYSRLAPARLLEQEKRDLLHRLVRDEPGIHFSALRERTGLPNGVLVHHLRTLERHRLITSRRDGPLRRFAAATADFPAPAPPPVTPMQAHVLEILRERPMTQRQLAQRLGVTQQGANRHVKALERRGLLVIRYEDGEWRCHAEGAPVAAPPAVRA